MEYTRGARGRSAAIRISCRPFRGMMREEVGELPGPEQLRQAITVLGIERLAKRRRPAAVGVSRKKRTGQDGQLPPLLQPAVQRHRLAAELDLRIAVQLETIEDLLDQRVRLLDPDAE